MTSGFLDFDAGQAFHFGNSISCMFLNSYNIDSHAAALALATSLTLEPVVLLSNSRAILGLPEPFQIFFR